MQPLVYLQSYPIEIVLLALYAALTIKAAVTSDWPRVLYWGGCFMVTVGALASLPTR